MQKEEKNKSDRERFLDTLFASCAKLEKESSSVTVEEVQALSEESDAFQERSDKKMVGHKRPYLRIFSRMRMFSEYFKIRQLRAKIERLQKIAKANKIKTAIEKSLWQLQRKSFISPMDHTVIVDVYKELFPYVRSLGNMLIFTLRICDRDSGILQFILLEETKQSVFKILLDDQNGVTVVDHNAYFDTVEQFIQAYTENAIPFSQLQDIAIWLEAHGFEKEGVFHLLSKSVEEKLSALMQSCPNGAYILYPGQKGTLQLSRLLKRGEICHMTIDLQKAKGCYTFVLPSAAYSASRSEFKKKLEQMGAPVKVKG